MRSFCKNHEVTSTNAFITAFFCLYHVTKGERKKKGDTRKSRIYESLWIHTYAHTYMYTYTNNLVVTNLSSTFPIETPPRSKWYEASLSLLLESISRKHLQHSSTHSLARSRSTHHEEKVDPKIYQYLRRKRTYYHDTQIISYYVGSKHVFTIVLSVSLCVSKCVLHIFEE